MTAPPSLEDLAPIIGDLGLAPPQAIRELKGGSNAAFRVDLADGSAVVLKTYDELRGKRPGGETHAARFLAGLDIPVTRYLAGDESLARLPFRYAITNCLPGVVVSSFRDDPDVAAVYREMGALLGQLHTVRMPAFGHFEADGFKMTAQDNRTHMRSVLGQAFASFRAQGADPALAGRLEAIVDARAELFALSRGPVFAHDDVHVGNILADRAADGRLHLTGLIDFGNARAADAVSDLAKTLFMADHDVPGASPLIRQGYGPIDHPDPEAALWLYMLRHRVTMWSWLRYVGIIAEPSGHPLLADLRQMAEEGGPIAAQADGR